MLDHLLHLFVPRDPAIADHDDDRDHFLDPLIADLALALYMVLLIGFVPVISGIVQLADSHGLGFVHMDISETQILIQYPLGPRKPFGIA